MPTMSHIPLRRAGTLVGRRQAVLNRSFIGALSVSLLCSVSTLNGQVAATAATPVTVPPKAWIDKDTGHRVLRITDQPGSQGLYFDQQAFTSDGLDMIYVSPLGIHDLKLATFRSTLLVGGKVSGPIVGTRTRRVFYENMTDGRYYAIDIDTRLVTQLPRVPFRGHLTTVNADETLLAGTYLEGSSPELNAYRHEEFAEVKPSLEDAQQASLTTQAALDTSLEYLKQSVDALQQSRSRSNGSTQDARAKLQESKDAQANADVLLAEANAKDADAQAKVKVGEANAVRRRFEAQEPEDLFTLNLQTGEIKILLKGKDWLNHVEFSPTDPNLLMYAHEGPALRVDRVWTIRADSSQNMLMQKRAGAAGIATHEFWSHDGKSIWFDLQETKGEVFALAGLDLATGKKASYSLSRQEASMHYNISPDGSLFCGDGNVVAHGEIGVHGHRTLDRAWIELLRPYPGGVFHSTRLAHIAANKYERTEPNPRFSPDQKMVFFTSNMFGHNYIFAVEVAKEAAATVAIATPQTSGMQAGSLYR